MASDTIKDLDNSTFDDEVSKGVSLVDFWAPWCGPCRMLGPIVDKVADHLGAKASVFKVNIDEAQDIAVKFGIQAVPTMLIIKDGEVVDRMTGLQQENAILEKINLHL